MFFVKIVMEKREWFAFLFFIILFFPAVSASGVSPPQYGADFTPGAKLAFSFTFSVRLIRGARFQSREILLNMSA